MPGGYLFMTIMAKNMAGLHDDRKSLYSCVLWRKGCRSRKRLIDLMLERPCILMASMELCEKVLKSEKTNPFFMDSRLTRE